MIHVCRYCGNKAEVPGGRGRPRAHCDKPECKAAHLKCVREAKTDSDRKRLKAMPAETIGPSGHRICPRCWDPMLSGKEWVSVITALRSNGDEDLAKRIDKDLPGQSRLIL